MPSNRLGTFIVPTLVIVYSAYMIAEQFFGSYRETSRNYALFMGGSALVCAVIVVVRQLVGSDPTDAADEGGPVPAWHYVQLVAIVAMMALAVLIIPIIGYVVTIFALLVASLILLGVRSPAQILSIAVVAVLVVHFGFVRELDLPLPAGVLEGIL